MKSLNWQSSQLTKNLFKKFMAVLCNLVRQIALRLQADHSLLKLIITTYIYIWENFNPVIGIYRYICVSAVYTLFSQVSSQIIKRNRPPKNILPDLGESGIYSGIHLSPRFSPRSYWYTGIPSITLREIIHETTKKQQAPGSSAMQTTTARSGR